MKGAIFLDRDGTINKEVDNLRSVKQLRLLPGAARAIREMNRLGFLVIVITNQPVVARGWLTKKEVDKIHVVLESRLAKKGAKIDAIYYCPHHPDANLKQYRLHCNCRKPKPGLFFRAIKEWNVNPSKSFAIGDYVWDIEAGRAAGVKTILVKTSSRSCEEASLNSKPDFVVKNLSEAVKLIKKHGK